MNYNEPCVAFVGFANGFGVPVFDTALLISPPHFTLQTALADR
jgi:hypothetical protein